MSNAIYPKFKTALGTAAANVSLDQNTADDGVYVAMIDTDTYTYNASHEFYSDLSGIVGTPQRITTNTFGTVGEGILDGDDVTFPDAVTATVEALVIYRHNAGANTTWRLVAYLDSDVVNLPTAAEGTYTVEWNAAGILRI